MNESEDFVSSNDTQLSTLTRSEIEQQVSTARKFPRSVKRFRDEALSLVTLTKEVAEACVYALPRGTKTIEGPSARFAEVIAFSWGNNRNGARVVDDSGDFVTAQGVFHDLERNVSITYEVKRRITDAKGKRFNTDMIGVTASAACAIALRNAVLKGIPKALWSDAYDNARQVIMGDIKTLANRRADAVAAFTRYGVTAAQLCEKLGVASIDDVKPDDLVTLRGFLTALKEGEATAEEMFASAEASKVPDYTVRSKSETKAKAAAEDKPQPSSPVDVEKQETVIVDGATVAKATGEVLQEAPAAETAQEAQQAQVAETRDDAPAKPADAAPVSAQEARTSGGEFGADLTQGQVRQIRSLATRKGRSVQDVVDFIGGQINAGSINRAVAWLEKQAVQS